MGDGGRLKLEWRRTWEDKPYDFSCFDNGNRVGRIYRERKPRVLEDWWFWALNGSIESRNVWLSESGYADSKIDAAEAVEEAYFRALERATSSAPDVDTSGERS